MQKAPIESIQVVDVPFKRVVVDLIGPKEPASEHFDTCRLCYKISKAVPLKRMDNETVPEALVDTVASVF